MKCVIPEFLKSGCILSTQSREYWVGWGPSVRTSQPPVDSIAVYAPDFFLKDETPWWQFPFFEKRDGLSLCSSLLDFLKESGEFEFPSLPQGEAPDFEIFKKTFSELQTYFKQGKLKKAVPVVFEKANYQLDPFRFAHLLQRLVMAIQDLPLFVYGVWDFREKSQGILGATPELLLQWGRDRVIRTVALAGTRPLQSTRPSLFQDPKELDEHGIVVDGISSALAKYGKVEAGKVCELSLPTLSHLMTPLQLQLEFPWSELKSTDLLVEILDNLHPTPALGAFPREEGRRWLESYESQVKRYRFGAPFGILDESGECQCVVSIRNIQWFDSTLLLGAGCGILPASELNREWHEIQMKIQSLKRLIGWESA